MGWALLTAVFAVMAIIGVLVLGPFPEEEYPPEKAPTKNE